MNTLIIYFSKFGHTQRITETMAQALGSNNDPARLISADQLNAADLQDADLVVIGSPTHNMNLPETVRPVLESLPRRCMKGKQFAAFDTSYKMNWLLARFTAASRLSRKLRKLGGKQTVRPETFFVEAREGPLFEGELERAGAWAASLNGRPEKEHA